MSSIKDTSGKDEKVLQSVFYNMFRDDMIIEALGLPKGLVAWEKPVRVDSSTHPKKLDLFVFSAPLEMKAYAPKTRRSRISLRNSTPHRSRRAGISSITNSLIPSFGHSATFHASRAITQRSARCVGSP